MVFGAAFPVRLRRTVISLRLIVPLPPEHTHVRAAVPSTRYRRHSVGSWAAAPECCGRPRAAGRALTVPRGRPHPAAATMARNAAAAVAGSVTAPALNAAGVSTPGAVTPRRDAAPAPLGTGAETERRRRRPEMSGLNRGASRPEEISTGLAAPPGSGGP